MKCCHCGAPSYGGNYCDPCNTDSCLALDDNGDTYCRLYGLHPAEDDPEVAYWLQGGQQ